VRYVEAAEVVSLLGIPANDGSNGNAKTALDVVSPLIENKVGTRLSRFDYLDFFSCKTPRYQTSFVPIILRLDAGYILSDSFELRGSSDGKPLRTDTDGEVIDPEDYLLDAQRGVVTLLRQPAADGVSVVLAKYTAGFDQDSDGLLEDDTAPAWMAEAAKTMAMKLIQMNPANVVNKKINAFTDVQNALYDSATGILNPNIRPRMGMVWPDRTVATDLNGA
jgi:hypothetical protein